MTGWNRDLLPSAVRLRALWRATSLGLDEQDVISDEFQDRSILAPVGRPDPVMRFILNTLERSRYQTEIEEKKTDRAGNRALSARWKQES